MDNEQQLTDAYPAVIGLVDQQPKLTIKKLQLKIVSFTNGNLSHILASILHRSYAGMSAQPSARFYHTGIEECNRLVHC